MFDLSFSEIMVIGIVALIVIGPERLPKVARTVGHLVGRAQRYVSNVKTDIQREMELSELNNLKNQVHDAAQSMQASMQEASDTFRKPLEDARDNLTSASESLESLMDTARQELGTSNTASSSSTAPPADLLTRPDEAVKAAQTHGQHATQPATVSAAPAQPLKTAAPATAPGPATAVPAPNDKPVA